MTATTWDIASDFDFTDQDKMKIALSDFNANLVKIGLIPIDNDTTISNLVMPSTVNNSTLSYICNLDYQFPVGTGNLNVQYNDDKTKITRGVYDNTPCYIRFKFILCGVTSTSGDLALKNINKRNVYFKAHMFASKDKDAMESNTSTKNIFSNNVWVYQGISEIRASNDYQKLYSTKCYASLNEDSFFILWGNLKVENTNGYASGNQITMISNKYIISQLIQRKDGILTLTGMKNSSFTEFLTPSTNDRQTYNTTINNGISTNYPYAMNWSFNLPLLDTNGNINLLPTVLPKQDGTFAVSNNLYVTKCRGGDIGVVIEDVQVEYQGKSITRTMINLNNALTWRPYSNENYSWAIVFDDYPVTTK